MVGAQVRRLRQRVADGDDQAGLVAIGPQDLDSVCPALGASHTAATRALKATSRSSGT